MNKETNTNRKILFILIDNNNNFVFHREDYIILNLCYD